MFTATSATHKVINLNKRIRLLAGGTSASKTISVLLYLVARAQSDKTPTLTSIVSESFPHLRRGAMRDFINIMEQHGYFKESRWSKTDYTYTFETGSRIEFFSADQPGKVRGPRRDRLFVNEVNNVAKESWEQLLLRTRELAFADWNPTNDFYMYEDYGLHDEHDVPYADDPDADFLILTYKDNESLEDAIVNEIEKRRVNKNWFRVYGEGKRGEMEGKIFRDWRIIPDIPHEARLEVRGMDFGYARDPDVVVDIYYYNGGYILDEVTYRIGMKDRQVADVILNQPDPHVLVIGDSADKKGIETMQEYGVPIIGVEKKGTGGDTFTNAAIKFVQSQKVSITKRSTNLIKSYRNFMWQTDKEGNIVKKYDHFWSDGMMAVVYGMTFFNASRSEDDDAPLDDGIFNEEGFLL